MRPELLQPNGELTDEVLADMLAIAGAPATAGRISQWAPLERAIAYDWAAREYLHASDNPVHRRPRPSLLGEETPGSPVTREASPEHPVYRKIHQGEAMANADSQVSAALKTVSRWQDENARLIAERDRYGKALVHGRHVLEEHDEPDDDARSRALAIICAALEARDGA